MSRLEETRADIARRRLAQLAASFNAEFSLPPDGVDGGAEPQVFEQNLDTPESVVGNISRRTPRILGRHLVVVVFMSSVALVFIVWWVFASRPEQAQASVDLELSHEHAPAQDIGDDSPEPGAAISDPPELIIDVVGKVERPGIVTVPAGARVHEAIAAAGGLVDNPDTTAINMARVLTDGEQIVVGIESAAPLQPAAGGTQPGALINLNTADVAQLDTLAGVGPVTAQAIVDWREANGRFTSVDDLLDVKGIGPATLADLRDRVTV